MSFLRNPRRLAALAVIATAGLASACLEDDAPVIVDSETDGLFDRYVSVGNSITAGFQSGGIHIDFQRTAYPVLLANRAGASFGIPGIAKPGCPPPVDAPFGSPISTFPCGGATGAPRVLRPPTVVQNVAVPGADVVDLSSPLGTGTPLNGFLLGGRTQLQAMMDADPTFVSVWIGANEVLSQLLRGDTAGITTSASFIAAYAEVEVAIRTTDARDALLVGVPDPTTFAPILQPGAYYWAIANSGSPPPGLPTLDVSDNCAPFDLLGNPNPLSARPISMAGIGVAVAESRDPIVIDCQTGIETSLPFDFLLDETEIAYARANITEYNHTVEDAADDNGWIYVEPSTVFAPILADPAYVRKCQDLAGATDAATFAAAVASSCPVDLDPATAETFFGSAFSFDGIHPSDVGHELIADVLAAAINARYSLGL